MRYFIIFSLVLFQSISQAREVDTLASCRLTSEDQGDESLASYNVLRDGDRLYGRYRLNEGRDFEETDDIFMKKYEGKEDLERLKERGILAKLALALKIEESKIEKVSFFGIQEIEDEDEEDSPAPEEFVSIVSSEEDPLPPPTPAPPVFLMEIYKLSGSLGVSLGSIGRPLEQEFAKCNGSRLSGFPFNN